MVDSHVILSRVDKIRECVAKLRGFADLGEESFLAESSATDNAERNIQVAIQAAIDIGNHIVADMDLGAAKDYKDIFQLLSGNIIITAALAAKLISMTGLRNVLVHDYLDIDLRLIYRIIRDDLGDFEEFISSALKLV